MEITVFAKKRRTHEGKTFYSYLTKMKRKDGSEIVATVKFREECGSPKSDSCPLNIVVDKRHANLSKREQVREDTGLIALYYTLWVSEWSKGSEYVDKSLDDFED